ncbi:MAG: hypothetical protein ACRCYU_12855, partial [Nocardioides sp.]
VAYSAMIFFLVSASVPIDMGLLRFSLRGAPGPVHPGTVDPRPFHGNLERLPAREFPSQNEESTITRGARHP